MVSHAYIYTPTHIHTLIHTYIHTHTHIFVDYFLRPYKVQGHRVPQENTETNRHHEITKFYQGYY